MKWFGLGLFSVWLTSFSLLADAPNIFQVAYSPSHPEQIFLWVEPTASPAYRGLVENGSAVPLDQVGIYVGNISLTKPLADQRPSFRRIPVTGLSMAASAGHLLSLQITADGVPFEWNLGQGIRRQIENRQGEPPGEEEYFYGSSEVLKERLNRALIEGRLTLSDKTVNLRQLLQKKPGSRLKPPPPLPDRDHKADIVETLAPAKRGEFMVGSGDPLELLENVFKLPNGYLILRDNSFKGRDILAPLTDTHIGWILTNGSEVLPIFSAGGMAIDQIGRIYLMTAAFPLEWVEFAFDNKKGSIWIPERETPLILAQERDGGTLKRIANLIIEKSKNQSLPKSQWDPSSRLRVFRYESGSAIVMLLYPNEGDGGPRAILGDLLPVPFGMRTEVIEEAAGMPSVLVHTRPSLNAFLAQAPKARGDYVWVRGSAQSETPAATVLEESHIFFGHTKTGYPLKELGRAHFPTFVTTLELHQACQKSIAALAKI